MTNTKFNFPVPPLTGLCLLLLLIPCCIKEVNTNPTNGKTTALFNPGKTYGSLTDQDGNIYKTIVIGSQTWMAENLRTTRYRWPDGGYYHMGIEGGWWTVTEGDTNLLNAYHVTMGYDYACLGGCNCPKRGGYSIRCVKDLIN
ncbi:MAG: hypothetical protein Q8M08_07895 [Bacteroidales bacterium]|nr:hypothetical protein [Bacteroidales bacterium]